LSYQEFGALMKEVGGTWEDSSEYRQRHLLKAIRSKTLF